MKQTLSILIVLLLSLSAFAGCDNVLPQNDGSQTTKDTLNADAECEHNWNLILQSEYEYKCSDCKETHLCVDSEDWERAGNLNESTAIYKCKICGAEHLITDPDSTDSEYTSSKCESPDEHDWQVVSRDYHCWFSDTTYACSKCDEKQINHADYALPSHEWEGVTAYGKTTFNCTRCKESITYISEIGEFSYAQTLEEYKIGDPGVKHEHFNNWSMESEIKGAIDAIVRAQFEITIEYDTISVFYDETSNMWRVNFWTLNLEGSSQSVYVNGKGLTCYIVYGE